MANYIAASYADRTSYVPLLHVTGAKGTLEGIGISGAKREHYFKIKIDNEVIHDGLNNSHYFTKIQGKGEGNHSLATNFQFEEELEVQICDYPTRWINPRYWAAYQIETDQMTVEEEKEASEYTTREKLVYKQVDLGDSQHISHLQGNRLTAQVKLEKDTYEYGEDLSLQIYAVDWRGNQSTLSRSPYRMDTH